MHGGVVSAILIPATFTGLFAGNIADLYGRSTTMILGVGIFGIGATMEAAATTLALFIFGRVIAGLGEGLFLGTLTVHICEIAPARRRGPLASLPQFLTTVGIAAGYFISYGTTRISKSSASWRIPLAFQAFVAFAFALACFTLPPSPRWLQAKGRMDEARAVLDRLGLASSEFEEMTVEATPIAEERARSGLMRSIRFTLRDFAKVFAKGSRSRAGLACFLMAFQQLSGIDGLLYYSPLLFQQAGLASDEASFLASGVSALIMLAVTIPASIFSDHWGRRGSAIAGGITLSTCMLLIGSLYASNVVHGEEGAARWIVIAAIYLFGIFFCSTWAISFKIYSTEIQPTATRASAASLAQSANWVRKRASYLCLRC
jgi:sugar porter (SP) family MFS transporter